MGTHKKHNKRSKMVPPSAGNKSAGAKSAGNKKAIGATVPVKTATEGDVVVNVITGGFAAAKPAPCPTPTWPYGNSCLWPNEHLRPGDCRVSSNGRYKLEWQLADGNLVFTDTQTNKCTFSADVGGNFGPGMTPDQANSTSFKADCLMQGDGNFVMLAQNQVVFQTGTDKHPGAFLLVSEDGNVVIIDPNFSDYVIWHRGIMPW